MAGTVEKRRARTATGAAKDKSAAITLHHASPKGNDQARGSRYYREIFVASPETRIGMIRKGVPATDAKRIIIDLGVEQRAFFRALGFKTATVNRKVRQNEQLTSDESERLLGVAKLVGQIEAIVADSGDPEGFDAPEWLSRWLREPLPALRGQAPISFLDTMEGQAIVSDVLSRIQSGAYA